MAITVTRDPHSRYIHPRQALREVAKLIVEDKIPAGDILRKPHYKRDREKFVGAIFSLAVRDFIESEVFFQQPSDDPPDFRLTWATERKISEKPFDSTSVELVTIPSHISTLSDEDIVSQTRGIVEGKLSTLIQIPPSTTLLIFLNTEKQRMALNGVIQAINSSEKIQYFSIWILRILNFNEVTKDMEFAATHFYPNRAPDIFLSVKKELEADRKYPNATLEQFVQGDKE